jgi:hypothetical protein
MTDLLLRLASEHRPGAAGFDDYDVIGADGSIVGRIFKDATSPMGTSRAWTLADGYQEDRSPTHGYEATREGRYAGIRQELAEGDVNAVANRPDGEQVPNCRLSVYIPHNLKARSGGAFSVCRV